MWSENDTRDENYRVAYATGPSPTGPWTKQGVILEKDLSLGIKGPGHHSVVHVPGTDDWYIAYHRFAIPGGDGTHRETTIDKLEFGSDGLIKKVVPTLSGVDPVTVVHAGPDAPGNEGDAIALNGHDLRCGQPEVDRRAGAPCTVADPAAAATTVTCTDNGTFTRHPDRRPHSDTATVKVTNAAPAIVSATARVPAAGRQGQPSPPSFTDPGTTTPTPARSTGRTAAPTPGKVTGTGCRAEHAYAKAGHPPSGDHRHRRRRRLGQQDPARAIVYDRTAGPVLGAGLSTRRPAPTPPSRA